MHHESQQRRGRPLKWILLGCAILLIAVLVSGCGGGVSPLSQSAFQDLGKEMAAIEQMTPQELDNEIATLTRQAKGDKEDDVEARSAFLLGYIEEYRVTTSTPADERDYGDAVDYYSRATEYGSGYAAQARYRWGILAANGYVDNGTKIAKQQLQMLTHSQSGFFGGGDELRLWVRSPELAGEGGAASVGRKAENESPVLYAEKMSQAAVERLDPVYRTGGGTDAAYYRIVGSYVSWFKTVFGGLGAAMSLIFLALIIKLVTAPMTAASYRGMRDMQRVQPLIKELQEKYKDDRQKQAEEQMKLMKEHKVSPLGGCLPMLIQLPIFYVIYRAVQVYAQGFADSHFLWIQNLAQPDPALLVLYAVSMIVTQKLTATPATDPQQKMMQTQMTYLMPIMLFLFLQSLASAFVLYWFFLNVFSAIHQYYLMQKFKKEDEARGVVTATAAPATPDLKKKKGK